jgi:hypothetical protein
MTMIKKISKPNFPFHKYAKELSKYADNIDVFEATSTSRQGKRRLRDMFVFWRNTYNEGNYYLGMIKDLVYLVALIPLALSAIGLPPTLTILFAATYVTCCSVLGFVSYRFLALPRREKEMDDLMSMSRYLTWDMLKQIQVDIVRLEAQMKNKKRKVIKK